MPEPKNESNTQQDVNISIKIQSAPQVPELEGRILPFHSRDISLEGLQMTVDVPVPVGSHLELKIELGDASRCYWHTGTVMWDVLRPAAGRHRKSMHIIGVQFNTEDNPQFQSWQMAVADLFARDKVRWLH